MDFCTFWPLTYRSAPADYSAQKAYSRLQDVITLKASNRRWMNFLVDLMNKQLVSLVSRFSFMWPSSKQLSLGGGCCTGG